MCAPGLTDGTSTEVSGEPASRKGSRSSSAYRVARRRRRRQGHGAADVLLRALDGVSLAIDAGEFVAVMGPSGSGKSTFMNMIGCLDRPTPAATGSAGEDVAAMDADALAAIRNRASASCSSSSTCCRAPARWRTSSCR
jgi:ABC-type glutathione transport system ATPase component